MPIIHAVAQLIVATDYGIAGIILGGVKLLNGHTIYDPHNRRQSHDP